MAWARRRDRSLSAADAAGLSVWREVSGSDRVTTNLIQTGPEPEDSDERAERVEPFQGGFRVHQLDWRGGR
jgi:hypothetical protein